MRKRQRHMACASLEAKVGGWTPEGVAAKLQTALVAHRERERSSGSIVYICLPVAPQSLLAFVFPVLLSFLVSSVISVGLPPPPPRLPRNDAPKLLNIVVVAYRIFNA